MSKQLFFFFFFEAKWIISGVFDSVLLIKTLFVECIYNFIYHSNERPYIYIHIFLTIRLLYDVIRVFRVLLLEFNLVGLFL